jgi:hypothetical protein
MTAAGRAKLTGRPWPDPDDVVQAVRQARRTPDR